MIYFLWKTSLDAISTQLWTFHGLGFFFSIYSRHRPFNLMSIPIYRISIDTWLIWIIRAKYVKWNTRKPVGCSIFFYFLVEVSFLLREHYQNITEKYLRKSHKNKQLIKFKNISGNKSTRFILNKNVKIKCKIWHRKIKMN